MSGNAINLSNSKCEIVFENPNSNTKVECCKCNIGGNANMFGILFFKESIKNPNHSGCNKPLTLILSNGANVQHSRIIHDIGSLNIIKKKTHNNNSKTQSNKKATIIDH